MTYKTSISMDFADFHKLRTGQLIFKAVLWLCLEMRKVKFSDVILRAEIWSYLVKVIY